MKPIRFVTDDRAVSPVVGVALLIAITVILAAVIGGVVLGLGTGGVDTPTAQLSADLDTGTNTEVIISHDGGEPLPENEVVIQVGNDDIFLDGDLTAGRSVDLTDDDDVEGPLGGYDSETVTILWEDPNSDSTTVLAEFEP